MMKLTPANRKFIEFMSSNLGRVVRGLLGAALIISAVTMGEWYWLLAPFGVFMIFTAADGLLPYGNAFSLSTRLKKLPRSFPATRWRSSWKSFS
jgi:hypothetical protein